MARAGAALLKARQDVENARDARKPGDAAEDAADGGANALVAALKRKPRKAQLSGPISGLGRSITGAATSTTRTGY